MGSELDKLLRKHGMGVSGRQSQAYAAVVDLFDSPDAYDEVLGHEESRSKALAKELQEERVRAEQALAELKTAREDAKKRSALFGIRDTRLVQAVNMYDEVLRRTRECVGEDMTEGVWLKAIKAASYVAWGAMKSSESPKYDEECGYRG